MRFYRRHIFSRSAGKKTFAVEVEKASLAFEKDVVVKVKDIGNMIWGASDQTKLEKERKPGIVGRP